MKQLPDAQKVIETIRRSTEALQKLETAFRNLNQTLVSLVPPVCKGRAVRRK
jgi:hypothetical protein